MDTLSIAWRRELDRGVGVGRELYEEAIVLREDVMDSLEDLLESLEATDGLRWDDARHKPSRRVRRELQGAFNVWSRTWTDLVTAYDATEVEQPQTAASKWFARAS